MARRAFSAFSPQLRTRSVADFGRDHGDISPSGRQFDRKIHGLLIHVEILEHECHVNSGRTEQAIR